MSFSLGEPAKVKATVILVPRARRFLVTWSGNEGLWKQSLPDVGYKLSRVALGTRMSDSQKYVCARRHSSGAKYQKFDQRKYWDISQSNSKIKRFHFLLTSFASWECLVMTPHSSTSTIHGSDSDFIHGVRLKTCQTGYILVLYNLKLHLVIIFYFVLYVVWRHMSLRLFTCWPHDEGWVTVHEMDVYVARCGRNHCNC